MSGKHSEFKQDGRYRFRMKPAVAAGVALVIVVLTVFGVSRGLTMSEQEAAESGGGVASTQSGDDPQSIGYGLADGRGGRDADGSVSVALIVHVVGAVKEPGIVELPAGSRVIAAIDAAGGVSPDADTGLLNLAAFVSDGAQVTVPKAGEIVADAGNVAAGAGCVDLNTASEEELQGLDGVGPKIAARIVAWRGGAGPIQTAAELTGVPGIGSVLAERISVGTCQ